MKKALIVALIATLPFFITLSDGNAFTLGGKKLVKNGTGRRTKFIIGTVYYATLFVTEDMKGKSAKEIIEADKPSSVIMRVDSGLLTRERFVSAVKAGFAKAAASGYPTGKSQQFVNLFNKVEMNDGDVIYLNYVPNSGLTSSIKFKQTGKVQRMGTVSGLGFKKALYAIWLGKNPVQASCKRGMLGQ